MTDEFKVKDWKIEEIQGRKIWVPHMCDSAYILAAVLRGKGFEAGVLPRSEDRTFSLGRRYTDGDQCLPSIITTNDILSRVTSPDFDRNREAIFQGKSEGPCRFGRYYMNQQAILNDLGFGDVPIFTLDSNNAYGGIGSDAKVLAWGGMIAQALLERSLHFTRPVEMEKGRAEQIYQKSLARVCDCVEEGISGGNVERLARIIAGSHLKKLEGIAQSAVEEFADIPKYNSQDRPKVFVTGEIYVRTSDVANQDLIKRIESMGGIAVLEPAVGFFGYVGELKHREAVRAGNWKRRIKSAIELKIMERDEHAIGHVFEPVLGEFAHDPSGAVVIEHGQKYVNPRFNGETIVTSGASDYFSSRVQGVISAYPFACLPGTLCKAISHQLSRDNNGIPFHNMAFDGHQDPTADEVLGVFMYKLKERMKRK